ncbi:unnamed protein product (macronuclear) [Paramecium tetraurelia]|uniref:Alpha-ketoglutarate-dependent dioxygenase AlkB-like domain-containing protein n=1 Tax=Paramecium tetraurelia TaxID=5888 RepID=A0D6K7_PARTE|nr:uncharacterized protein GSPATT00001715001 [Paramecium tetraurelia]CAK78674.1 unnamed protein product [Paramecium tetraurelia]|eukprot:XP_001446071.1 hypothetical protein (macronuclear) [Paramecium tetraurelia strain d4-2]
MQMRHMNKRGVCLNYKQLIYQLLFNYNYFNLDTPPNTNHLPNPIYINLKLQKKGTFIEIVYPTKSSDEETIVKKRIVNNFNVNPTFWIASEQVVPPTLDFESLFKSPFPEQAVRHNETFEKLEVVTNTNQKILIDVPSRPAAYTLEKLNLKGKPTLEQLFQSIPNCMDYKERDKHFKQGGYKLNYQSGYAPVEIQNRHKDPEDYTKKQHFIRQKQSQANLNLKRTCGVSYVKKSESEQKDVSHIFKKLPPLVYQCSSGCQPIAGYDEAFDNLFQNLLNGKNLIVFTLFNSSDESALREYLLFPHLRNKISRERVMMARKFLNLWMLFQDALCLVIHYNYDENQLLRPIQLNEQEDIKQQLVDFICESEISICLLFKKSVSGRKAFLKSVGLWNEGNDNSSVCTETQREDIQTKFVISVPKVPINSNSTPQSLFQEFTNIIQQQENYVLEARSQTQGPQTEQQNSNNEKQTKKKKRAKILSSTDVRKDGGASDQLINYLIKEDGNHNINTCSIRMEMYVAEEKWKSANDHNKDLLNAFIKRVEHHVTSSYLIKMMNKRFKANEKGQDYIIRRSNKIYEIPTDNVQIKQNKKSINWTSKFTPENFTNLQTYKLSKKYQPISLDILKMKELSFLKQPLYCITTRDSFAFDLITKVTKVKLGDRLVDRLDFFFEPNNCPCNFKSFLPMFPEYQVGAHAYVGYFTNEELLQMEKDIYEMELKGFDGHYLPMTAQISHAQSNHHSSVRRTKFFFGYRYMWTKCQLAEPHSMVAAGVRRDVSAPPLWMRNLITKLENDNVVPKKFINSIACNVYHDGKEGLAQHFDDAVRFKQPIYTIRVFSDCRLSFGSQFYGFCNGAFAVPLPRGCILCMEEGSYAANAIKHCVRPCDMTGKSAALILRQMHDQVTQEAVKYDEQVDLPCHMSTLSVEDNAVPFGEQKRLEAELLS